MANVLTKRIFSCDSLGIISPAPIVVRAIMFYPDAVDDAFQLKWWDEDNPTTIVKGVTYTITTSTDDTITSTGNFTNAWADGNVIKCLKTTGSDTRVYGLIKTAGDNNAIVIHLSPFTTEASKVGNFANYPTYNAFRGHVDKAADTEYSMWFPFPGNGFEFPNLALDSLSSSAAVDIYVE